MTALTVNHGELYTFCIIQIFLIGSDDKLILLVNHINSRYCLLILATSDTSL